MAAMTSAVTVTNTGSIAGGKVVQAYMQLVQPYDATGLDAYAPNPVLYGYQKVFLKPGESKTLHFSTATDIQASGRLLGNTAATEAALARAASEAGLSAVEAALHREAALGWCGACDTDTAGRRWLRPGQYFFAIGVGSAEEARRLSVAGAGTEKGSLEVGMLEFGGATARVEVDGDSIEVPML